MRRWLVAVAGAALIASGCGGGSSHPAASSPVTLTITEPSHSLSGLPFYAAQRLGYFAAEGIKIDLVEVPGSSNGHVAAVVSGHAWGYLGGPEQAMIADARGGQLRSVVVLDDELTQFLVGRAGAAAGADLATTLRGKRVGVSGIGTTTNAAAKAVLRGLHLDPDHDVHLVENTDSARLAAMRAGALDFSFMSEPGLTSAEKAGEISAPLLSNRKALGDYTSLVVAVTTKTATTDKAVVQRLVDAVVKAERYLAGHPDRAVSVAQQEFPTVSQSTLTAAVQHEEDEGVWSADGRFIAAGLRTAAGIAAVTASLDSTKLDPKASVVTTFADHAPH